MLIYTYNKSGKKKKKNNTKKFREAQSAHNKFLASHGIKQCSRRKNYVTDFPNLEVSTAGVAPLSNQISGNGFKRTIDDYKWRSNSSEKPEEIKKAEDKKKRIVPAYNKGPLMYITDEADKVSLGRKV